MKVKRQHLCNVLSYTMDKLWVPTQFRNNSSDVTGKRYLYMHHELGLNKYVVKTFFHYIAKIVLKLL
jgi:hypothetical protein